MLKKFLLAVSYAAMVFIVAWLLIDDVQMKQDYARFKSDVAYDMTYRDDVSLDLPQDGNGWWTMLFTSDNWNQNPTEYRLVQWFNSDPGLVNLKSQTKFLHLTPKNSIYKNYGQYTNGGTQPAVCVVDAHGQPVYKAAGSAIPKTPLLLLKAIKKFIIKICPNCPRPDKPKPNIPQPGPPFQPGPYGPYLPDSVDEEDVIDEVEKQDDAWLIAALAGVISFIAVFIMLAATRRPDGTR